MTNLPKYSQLITFLLSFCSLTGLAQTREDSIAIATCTWDSMVVADGITGLHHQFTDLYGGLQDIYIAEIPLHCNRLKVIDHNEGRDLTSRKAEEIKASVAINGTYFDIGRTDRSICFTAVDGKVLDLTSIGTSQLCNGAVVIDSAGVEIVPWDTLCERTWHSLPSSKGKSVMVCGPLMLQNGKEETFLDQSHIMKKNPRSGIALKGGNAYFVVVDGRDDNRAIGVTIPEFAQFLRIMKMVSALNLDGGDSSTLWIKDKGIVNTPSDKGHERPVSNSLISKYYKMALF